MPKTITTDPNSDPVVGITEKEMNNFLTRRSMDGGFQGKLEPDETFIINLDQFEVGKLDGILKEVGLFPVFEEIPWEKLCVLAYRYPEASEYETGLFIASRCAEKNIMVGLPDSATESLMDRPYVGVTLKKNGNPDYRLCLGNGIARPVVKNVGKLEQPEVNLINFLIDSFLYHIGEKRR